MVLNPGNQALFPWLSKIAWNFTTYKFSHISFEYKTACATTTSGVFVTCLDKDQGLIPSTEEAIANSTNAKQSPFKDSYRWVVPKDYTSRLKQFFIRVPPGFVDPSASTRDVTTLDTGVMIFAYTPTSNIRYGTLYINYTVKLWNPQILLFSNIDTGDEISVIQGPVPATVSINSSLATDLFQSILVDE